MMQFYHYEGNMFRVNPPATADNIQYFGIMWFLIRAFLAG